MSKKTIIIVIVIILILIAIGLGIYFLTRKKDISGNSNTDLSNNNTNRDLSNNTSHNSTTPSGVSNPPVSKWQSVKNRGTDDNMVWSGKIYDAMMGDPIGTRHAPYEGGVGYNTGSLGTANVLNKQMADGLCENPCYWYYNHPNTPQSSKDKINNAALCDCSTNKSKNF